MSSSQRPAWPRSSATAVAFAPSACAARAALSPLPPATCTNPSGRWMSPRTSRSISKSLSTEGFAARQTITRRSPRSTASSASCIVGCASTPPAARVESAPHALAIARHRSSGSPPSIAARNPASNESPAPVVSTVATRIAAAVDALAGTDRDRAAVARLHHDESGRVGASTAIAASRSDVRARRVASISFGKQHVDRGQQVVEPAVPRTARVPVRIDRRGRPHPRALGEQLGRSGARARCRKYELTCTWRAEPQELGIDRAPPEGRRSCPAR